MIKHKLYQFFNFASFSLASKEELIYQERKNEVQGFLDAHRSLNQVAFEEFTSYDRGGPIGGELL